MRRAFTALVLIAAGSAGSASAQVVMGGMPGYAAPYWFGGAGASAAWSRRWAPGAGGLQYQLPQPVVWYEVGNGYTVAPQTGLPSFRRTSSTSQNMDGSDGRTARFGSVARYSRVNSREYLVRNVNGPMNPNTVARRAAGAPPVTAPAAVAAPEPPAAASDAKTTEPAAAPADAEPTAPSPTAPAK